MIEPACSDCGKPLAPNPKRKGTRCRRCSAIVINKDPEIRARAAASLRETLKDPALRARRARLVSVGLLRKMANDPDYARRQRDSGRRLGLSGTGIQRYPAGTDPRIRAGRSISRTKRKGIPAGYYDEYRRLVHFMHMPANEARRLVVELRDKDRKLKIRAGRARSRLAAMSPEDRIRMATRQLGAACQRLIVKEQRS